MLWYEEMILFVINIRRSPWSEGREAGVHTPAVAAHYAYKEKSMFRHVQMFSQVEISEMPKAKQKILPLTWLLLQCYPTPASTVGVRHLSASVLNLTVNSVIQVHDLASLWRWHYVPVQRKYCMQNSQIIQWKLDSPRMTRRPRSDACRYWISDSKVEPVSISMLTKF